MLDQITLALMRLSSRNACAGAQRPLRGVGKPRSFSSAAMAAQLVAPIVRMSVITEARSAARLFAFAALTALPAAEPSTAAAAVRLAGLPSGRPHALRAAS